MAEYHTLVFIFIYLSLVILYLAPKVDGKAWCFKCEIMAKCKVKKHFLQFSKNVDEGKIVEKTVNDPADRNMDRCLRAGYKINGTISDTICSAGEDSMCHAIAERTRDPLQIGMHCASCMILCSCPRGGVLLSGSHNNENPLKEDAIIIAICLASLYMLI